MTALEVKSCLSAEVAVAVQASHQLAYRPQPQARGSLSEGEKVLSMSSLLALLLQRL